MKGIITFVALFMGTIYLLAVIFGNDIPVYPK